MLSFYYIHVLTSFKQRTSRALSSQRRPSLPTDRPTDTTTTTTPARRLRQLRQPHEQLQHLPEIRRPQPRQRIPSLDRGKPRGAAAGIAAVRDVVEDVGVGVEDGVDEADGGLAGGETRFVDAVDDGGEDGRACGCVLDVLVR